MNTTTAPGPTSAPLPPDAAPAHQLWIELETRITCQRLHYRVGDEEAAATSVSTLFETVRALLVANPHAEVFQGLSIGMLNNVVRPCTGRWHGWTTQKRFGEERTRRMFRAELLELQARVEPFQKVFRNLAVGKPLSESAEAFLERHAPKLKTPPDASLGDAVAAGIHDQVGFSGSVRVEEINRAERTDIRLRRRLLNHSHAGDSEDKLNNATGLALSGGGIRSATFCLGIVQVLARRGLLEQIDYLSTVSGGGYLGSFLSCYLGTAKEVAAAPPDGRTGPPPEPSKADVQARITDAFGSRGDRESDASRHLRNNSKYLLNGGLWGRWMILGLLITGLAFNLLMLLPIPLGGALVATFLHGAGYWGAWALGDGLPSWASAAGEVLRWVAWPTAILWVAMPLVQAIHKGKPPFSSGAKVRGVWEGILMVLGLITITAALLFLLPGWFSAYAWLRTLLMQKTGGVAWDQALVWISGAASLLLGPAALKVKKSVWLKKTLLTLFLLSGPIFFLLVFLFVGTRLLTPSGAAPARLVSSTNQLTIPNGPPVTNAVVETNGSAPVRSTKAPDAAIASALPRWSWGWVAGIFGGLVVWGWFFVDLNTLAPHRYYRARLCECYLAMRGRNQAGWLRKQVANWFRSRPDGPETDSQTIGTLQRLPLSNLGTTGAAPYHLINCTVNLPGSREKNLRGRNGDFFMFSRRYCGSPVVGYVRTETMEKLDRHLDLGTAMAISGAAASSNMGIKTRPAFRFLLTLMNVRLGYWLRRPEAGPAPWWLEGVGPWYLFRELAGRMNERCRYLNLSDGGHIENLAVYELLRRRCKFIICVDGGAEPDMQCTDLLSVQRYAAIDLGVRIELDLADLRPDDHGLTRSHSVLTKIIYREARDGGTAEIGWLLYLKLAVTGAEPDYVRDYRRENGAFPHESTGDQFFGEAQFEAYRALGECAMKNLFREDLVGRTTPASVQAWFQGLTNNLLPDNDEVFTLKK